MAQNFKRGKPRLDPAPKRVLGDLKEVCVNLGVYPTSVWVVVGPHADLARYMAFRRPGETYLPPKTALGVCYDYDVESQGPVIWVRSVWGSKAVGTLAHEALHAMYFVTDNLGIRLTNDSQETFAYGISHIIKTVLKEVKK